MHVPPGLQHRGQCSGSLTLSISSPPRPGISWSRKKRVGNQRAEVRQWRVEGPEVSSDPAEATFPVCMCAHSSAARVWVCAGACACSTNTWHVCPASLCTPCGCKCAGIYLWDTSCVYNRHFHLLPHRRIWTPRRAAPAELRQPGRDFGISHAPSLAGILQESVIWLSESHPFTPTSSRLTKDLLVLRRKLRGNQKAGQKEGMSPYQIILERWTDNFS